MTYNSKKPKGTNPKANYPKGMAGKKGNGPESLGAKEPHQYSVGKKSSY